MEAQPVRSPGTRAALLPLSVPGLCVRACVRACDRAHKRPVTALRGTAARTAANRPLILTNVSFLIELW